MTGSPRRPMEAMLDDVQEGARSLVNQLAQINERYRQETQFQLLEASLGTSDGIRTYPSNGDLDDGQFSYTRWSRGLGSPSARMGSNRSVSPGPASAPAPTTPTPAPTSPTTTTNDNVPLERDPVSFFKTNPRKSLPQQAIERAMQARTMGGIVSERSDSAKHCKTGSEKPSRALSFSKDVKFQQRSSQKSESIVRTSGHSNNSSEPHTPNPTPALEVLHMRLEWQTREEAELIAAFAVDDDGQIERGVSKDHFGGRFNPFATHHAAAIRFGTASAETPSSFQSDRSAWWHVSWITHPRSRQRLLWDLMSLAFIVHDSVTLPMYAADMRQTPRFIAANFIIAAFWLSDMVMSTRMGFFDGPRYERRKKACMLHYLRRWFPFDVLLIVPELGLMVLLIDETYAPWLENTRTVLLYMPLLRLVKIPLIMSHMESFMVSSYQSLGFSLIRILFLLLLLVHFLSCGWYAVGVGSRGEWVELESLENEDLYYKYAASARWVLAQINGRTDLEKDRTMLERLYTVMCALIAVVIMSILISALTTKMLELEKVMNEASRNSRLLDLYLRHHGKVSSNTAFYARTYLKKVSHMEKDQEFEDVALPMLPRNVRRDLLYEVRAPLLVKHDFFQEVDVDFHRAMRSLCSHAVRMVKVRGFEILFEKDDVCHRMLFTERGECRYNVSETGTSRALVLAASSAAKSRTFASIMHANAALLSLDGDGDHGDHIGIDPEALGQPVRKGMWVSEPALWMSWLNRGELIASTDCTLLSVEVEPFIEVIRAYRELEFRAQVYAHIFRARFLEREDMYDIMEPLVTQRVQSIIQWHAERLDEISATSDHSGGGGGSREVSCIPFHED